jgi:ABC-type multidrug transport system ATPase subunit
MGALGLLEEHADKKVKELSGGTKRKLAVGIALISDSRVIFLDEPSCGVDPSTRQTMWTAISGATEGRVIVLTTHSMDEADKLAHRIGILVNGRLEALGSSQELKAKLKGPRRARQRAIVKTCTAIHDPLCHSWLSTWGVQG